MCDVIEKISILNCHPKYKIENESFWLVLQSFYYNIFTNFPKKIGGGGTEKSLARLLFNQTEWYQSVNKKLAEHPR